MVDRVPQDQDKYVLRFPDGMRDRLKDEAAKNGRSLNAEIVFRLAQTLEEVGAIDFNEELGFMDEIDALRGELDRVKKAITRADNLLLGKSKR